MCCDAVVWRLSGRVDRIHTTQDLMHALGGDVALHADYGTLADLVAEGPTCLCPVDMPATAKRYGFRAIAPAYGADTWHADAWGLKEIGITDRRPSRPKCRMILKGEVARLP